MNHYSTGISPAVKYSQPIGTNFSATLKWDAN